MSIVDLINKAGLENTTVQFLSASICGIVRTDKNGITTLTFKTNQVSCGDIAFGRGKIGIIVWLPVENVMPESQSPTKPNEN